MNVVMKMILLLLLLCPPLLAQENSEVDIQQEPMSARHFSAGLMFGNILYREPGLMKESGTMYGIHGHYFTHFNNSKWFIQPELALLRGSLRYDGQYQDGTPATSNTEDSLTELRVLFGMSFQTTSKWILRPFGGLGMRMLKDKILGSGGYRREISYTYLPFGVQALKSLNEKWNLELKAEYDFFVSGKVTSYLSDTSVTYPDLVNEQRKGYGMRASVMASCLLSEKTTLAFGPFIQYWDIEDSEKTTVRNSYRTITGYEPKNDSRFYGLQVSALLY